MKVKYWVLGQIWSHSYKSINLCFLICQMNILSLFYLIEMCKNKMPSIIAWPPLVKGRLLAPIFWECCSFKNLVMTGIWVLEIGKISGSRFRESCRKSISFDPGEIPFRMWIEVEWGAGMSHSLVVPIYFQGSMTSIFTSHVFLFWCLDKNIKEFQ